MVERAARPTLCPGLDSIEIVTHDFFTPQPIIGTCPPRLTRLDAVHGLSNLAASLGARSYYLRSILHDWPDDKCVEILENLRLSMTSDSVVLIDEIVLSEKGAPHRATQYDIIMMVATGAMERTGSEWRLFLAELSSRSRRY